MQNNTFEIPGNQFNAFCEGVNIDSPTPINNTSNKDIETVSNLNGFYIRLLENSLKDDLGHSNFSVKPAYNNKASEDFGNPVITVSRTSLGASNISVMGDKKPINIEPMPGMETPYSIGDSYSVTDMFEAGFQVTIYGSTLSETTKIQETVFNILFAISFNTLSDIFKNISYVTPPLASPVMPEERAMELYIGQITFGVNFINSANILVKKRLIELARLSVREDSVENVIWNKNNL